MYILSCLICIKYNNIQYIKLIKWLWTLSNISHSTFRLNHFIITPKMEWICRLLSWQIAYWLCFPTHVICLLRSGSSESNLAPTIDAIVRLPRHRYLPNFSAEVCIVTTNVSTLSQTHPELIRLLNSQHPVKFGTEQPMTLATSSMLVLLCLSHDRALWMIVPQ